MNYNENNLVSQLGGILGIKNRLNDFSNQFAQTTDRSPQEVGREIQQQMTPEQFQTFAAIADAVVGRKR